MKPNEIAQIEFIKDCLRKGEQRKTILGKFGEKWESLSKNTFDRRLNEAKKALESELGSISEKSNKIVQEKVDEFKSQILTVLERKAYLTQIVKGEVEVPLPMQIRGEVITVPTKANVRERIVAIAELNKMEGDYAATKAEITINKPTIIDWAGEHNNTNTETT
jgi:hypothetical protein